MAEVWLLTIFAVTNPTADVKVTNPLKVALVLAAVLMIPPPVVPKVIAFGKVIVLLAVLLNTKEASFAGISAPAVFDVVPL